MACYVIGDIHGCFDALQRLLRLVVYSAGRDRLWLVGDLVNKGPESSRVLDWARAAGEAVTAVLGNHDLRLLAIAAGICPLRADDDFGNSLPDDTLLDWLAGRPLLHTDGDNVLVHAGLAPAWSVSEAVTLARQAERLLRGPQRAGFLKRLLSDPPPECPQKAGETERLAWAAGVMTRLRLCDAQGRPRPDFTGSPSIAPAGCRPWFECDSRRPAASRVFFGHWARLGLDVRPRSVGLDSGCVYGGHLTAFRLEDESVFQVSCNG